MKDNIKSRVLEEAKYILENNKTIRQMAIIFTVSKSTVHYDLSTRLKFVDFNLYLQIKEILDFNFCQKHIRGGNATREKYKNVNNNIKNANYKNNFLKNFM